MSRSHPPVVALVGRVNVGKSRLFNRLLAEPKAIVSVTPGTTRDRSYAPVQWRDVTFRLVDTGGLVDGPSEELLPAITAQTQRAIDESDLVLLVLDGRTGVTPVDREVVAHIRHPRRPFFAVVNKVDDASVRKQTETGDAFRLGAREVFLVSARNGVGTGDLLDGIVEVLGRTDDTTDEEEVPALAIVGRPNVGKSSLLNRLVNEERQIVHDAPHTTREPQDIPLVRNGRRVRVIDTAGIRRRAQRSSSIEDVSVEMAQTAMENAAVVALVIDATELVTSQDQRLARAITDANRPLIIVANKWDRMIDQTRQTAARLEASIRRALQGWTYAPFLTVSALTGIRVPAMLDLGLELWDEAHRTLTPEQLDDLQRSLPANGDRSEVKAVAQVGVNPPTFAVTVTRRTPMSQRYRHTLLNAIRDRVGFTRVPIDVTLQEEDR